MVWQAVWVEFDIARRHKSERRDTPGPVREANEERRNEASYC